MSPAKIKVPQLAYVRLRSPDLGKAEEFLTDFGLIKVERTASKLFMRGTDAGHPLHVTELGEPGVIGFGYLARDASDLAALAGPGAVETVDEPGGGRRVRLTDPLGFAVDVIADTTPLPALPVQRQPLNLGAHGMHRPGELMRVGDRGVQVKRIGHAVVHATDLGRVVSWYRETLGLLGSDEVWIGSPDHIIGSFNRLDRGSDYVDHHVLFVVQQKRDGLNHISFEVQDFDDVMRGHQLLKQKGKYTHRWGIGRHYLGSQIFDYWEDPWGRIHEHWTDSDMLNASAPLGSHPFDVGFGSQWGDAAPEAFVNHSSR